MPKYSPGRPPITNPKSEKIQVLMTKQMRRKIRHESTEREISEAAVIREAITEYLGVGE